MANADGGKQHSLQIWRLKRVHISGTNYAQINVGSAFTVTCVTNAAILYYNRVVLKLTVDHVY